MTATGPPAADGGGPTDPAGRPADAAEIGAREPGAEPAPEPAVEPAPEPDARFSFANERTFLAWIRTALALITAGLAVTQLLPPFDVPGGRRLIGLPLIVLGTAIALVSYRQWQGNERAMRTAAPLPRSPLPLVVAVVVGAVAIVGLVLAAFGGGGSR